MIRAKVKTRIKVKKKPCDECKTPFLPKTSFEKWCSPDCGYKLAMKKLAAKKKKEEQQEEKDWKVRKKEGKEKLKKPGQWKEELQDEINHIVRLIDKGHECISSGAKFYQVNAGHLYSRGAFPELRYNLLNIYNQSVHDNHFKSSNGVIYKERIKEVFGPQVSEEIEGLKAKYKELQLSIPEIKDHIKVARSIVRELKKETEDLEKPFTVEERIEKRRHYNQILNIYL